MLCWFLPYNSVNQPYITFSRIWFSVTPWTAACQASLSITNSGACSNSCLSSQWCHPTISTSVISFFSCLQSFPALGFFLMSQFSVSGSQSTGVSALDHSFQRNPRADLLQNGLVGSPCSPRDSQESSPTPQFNWTTQNCQHFTILMFTSIIFIRLVLVYVWAWWP